VARQASLGDKHDVEAQREPAMLRMRREELLEGAAAMLPRALTSIAATTRPRRATISISPTGTR